MAVEANFEVIPAIDLRGGQAVRLQKGDFGTAKKVAEDPVAVAKSFEAQGATRIHVVDLDASRTGIPHEAEMITAIIRAVSVPVQIGGGIRSLEIIERLLRLGANRLIVGTSAARDAELTARMLEKYSEKIIIGADTAEGFVAVQGWEENTGESAESFGKRMVALGAQRFLFTDIARDGMLEGPNIEATRAFARAVGVPVIASGGVSGVHDIENLFAAQPDGIEGVIIGKALYAGRLTLAAALEATGG